MIGLLRAVDLEKSFGSRKVVDRVTVEVRKGEVVGLLGPNGAGKTTTFSMIMGLVSPDKGRVCLGDEDISRCPTYVRARKGIGLLSQEASSFRRLSVEENLMAVLETSPSGEGGRRARAADALEEFGLADLAHALAVTLSGGERRRLEIARAMILDPEYLLLDEPFTGVDPLAVQDVQGIIRKLKERGLGVLLTDHSVRETLKITDRTYIMDGGTVIQEGSPEEILASEPVRKSYLGEDFRP